MRDYVRAHDVPYNPLHDAGFPSIGCAPCTRAVAEGEDARSGRWWWEAAEHRECGLHHRGAGASPRHRPARKLTHGQRDPEPHMNQLETLEAKSVHILREAYRSLGNVCMLWSIGKDSTVLLHLARKAFFGHVPFPLVHIDTAYKMPEMIEYRDRLALEWRLNLVVGQNREALTEKATFPDGNCDRIACCRNLKTRRSSTPSTANGRGCAWTTPWAGWSRTRTSPPTPA